MAIISSITSFRGDPRAASAQKSPTPSGPTGGWTITEYRDEQQAEILTARKQLARSS
jgi:hypothetical protein